LYLCLIILIGVALGVPALIGNGLMEPHTVGWGGRELGIAVGAILALILRSPAAYFVIFVIGIFREISDVLEALAETPTNTTSALMIAVFIVLGAISAWFSYRATHQ
jgi:hypothetical protein